jgi:tetratricopeptide (TPR) repeat protein
VTKTNFLHTAFVLVLNSLLISGNIFGAENPSSEEIKKVDSLNSIAFKEKRFAVAKALNDLFVAENIASTAGYQKGLATTFLYQAGIYQQIGYDQRALSVYYKSLQIFKELKDTFHIAFTNQQIASSLQSSGNTDEAIQVYTESLSIFTLLNKQEDIVNSKNSLGLVYTGLQKFDLAESNLNEALRLGKDIGYVYGEKKAYYHLGLLEFRKNNLQAAEIYFRESLAKDRGLHDRYGAALNLLQLAAISLKKEKYDSVIIDALLACDSLK